MMMMNRASLIKRNLENIYDIPFEVIDESVTGTPCFIISPHSDDADLFSLKIWMKNDIRIILEVTPCKYSGNTIRDMALSEEEKKYKFSKYADLFISKGAKVDFKINDLNVDPLDFTKWPESWFSYSCRISKSPVCDEDGSEDIFEIFMEWSTLCMGMFLSLLKIDLIVEDETGNQILPTPKMEGCKYSVVCNKYERNPVNRELCLSAKGYKCQICGFDFEKTYGDIGKKFIHVHHIVPLCEIGHEYLINPLTDLIPVCPNCHAMLHRGAGVLKPEELRERIKEQSNNLK